MSPRFLPAAVCDVATAFEADNRLFVVAAEMRVGIATSPVRHCVSARANVDRICTPVVVTPTPATPTSLVPGNGHVTKTKDNNAPWQFDMNQNGKRMTAAEFDAWMKAKGTHVATGKATSVAGSAAAPSGQ